MYKENIEELKHVFAEGCPIKHNKLERLYMELEDFEKFMEGKGLLGGRHAVSRMVIKEAYVWSQRRTVGTKASTSKEEMSLRRMDFYEFLEALALIAIRMHSDPVRHQGMDLRDKLETLVHIVLGRGPSIQETHLKEEMAKLGFGR